MELFELIQTLVSAHGPSGNEGGIREAIRKLAASYGGEASTDTMGNLTIHKPGPGPKVMLCAHMDSIGFIVTHIEKEGFLRVGKLGGVAPQEILYTPVRFQNGVRGVVVKEEKASFSKLKLDECYLDIGARDEAQAREMVQIGDTAVYDTPTFVSGGKVISPYLDNRISWSFPLRRRWGCGAPKPLPMPLSPTTPWRWTSPTWTTLPAQSGAAPFSWETGRPSS